MSVSAFPQLLQLPVSCWCRLFFPVVTLDLMWMWWVSHFITDLMFFGYYNSLHELIMSVLGSWAFCHGYCVNVQFTNVWPESGLTARAMRGNVEVSTMIIKEAEGIQGQDRFCCLSPQPSRGQLSSPLTDSRAWKLHIAHLCLAFCVFASHKKIEYQSRQSRF